LHKGAGLVGVPGGPQVGGREPTSTTHAQNSVKFWIIAEAAARFKVYDAVGNVTNVVYPVSPAISMAYDMLNRLTNMVDGVGTTIYGYDEAGQLLTEDGPWPSDTVTYAYTNRLRTGLSLAQPSASAWTNGYLYDATKRLTNITSQAGAFGYAYGAPSTASALVRRLSVPNGSFITNTYDNVARLLSTKLLNPQLTTLNSHGCENEGTYDMLNR
jgi:YD repeat-containing protein